MESHVGDPLSLTQLAMVAGVSTRHLNRLFVQALGRTVTEHYRDIRLQSARRLLRSTALDIGEIADATGLANAGHLSNAYKARFGVRPRAERKLSGTA